MSFRKYVLTVMGKEWPSYLPQAVVEAGAVAVKQYAWYHAVYSSRSSDGRCFDVRDGTGDQLYKPNRSRIHTDHHRALDVTWSVTLRKNGRFFMTGYRRGESVNCGRDATGYKLLARSASRCANKGHGWRQILSTYYGPGLEFVDGGGASESSGQTPHSQTPDSAAHDSVAPDSAATTAGAGFFGSTTGGVTNALQFLVAGVVVV